MSPQYDETYLMYMHNGGLPNELLRTMSTEMTNNNNNDLLDHFPNMKR